MRALLLTNEFPPEIYGGAGVHVDELSRHLRELIELDVRTFGTRSERSPGWRVQGYPAAHDVSATDERLRPMLGALSSDISMVAEPVDADIVHVHTWYTHFAGILARLAFGIPLVLTAHSLEPLRPWKREQLGGGYDVSSWIERTAIESADAVIAVSRGTRDDILRLFDLPEERVHVIHNGIDPDFYQPDPRTDALARHGVDPAVPYVLFVGRITRQKGIVTSCARFATSTPGSASCSAPGSPIPRRSHARWERECGRRRPSGRT